MLSFQVLLPTMMKRISLFLLVIMHSANVMTCFLLPFRKVLLLLGTMRLIFAVTCFLLLFRKVLLLLGDMCLELVAN